MFSKRSLQVICTSEYKIIFSILLSFFSYSFIMLYVLICFKNHLDFGVIFYPLRENRKFPSRDITATNIPSTKILYL